MKNPSIGFWINYWGDVEAIVRETFTRAVEVAFGLEHGQTMTTDELADLRPPHRFWPISVFLNSKTPVANTQ